MKTSVLRAAKLLGKSVNAHQQRGNDKLKQGGERL